MKFFTVTDQSNVKHKVLVVPLSQTEMNKVVGQCERCMPSIAVSSLMQMGHPYVIIDFGGDGAWKTAIPLDQESEDGHKIGDELAIGDVLNVILTADPKAMQVSKEKIYMNVPLEAILAFSILYNAEMSENYALFKMYTKPKGE
jgi:hypothetical protein